MAEQKRVCFVISPIGPPESETRKRSDQVLNHIIKPVIEPRDYLPIRAEQVATPGSITNQVIQDVMSADLAIADLTDLNANVMYELGIRHAAQKPTIHIAETGTKLPFDLAGHRTIFVTYNDPNSADNCRRDIARQVEAIESDPNAWDNPVTVTLDILALRTSDRTRDRALAGILTELQHSRMDSEFIRGLLLNMYGQLSSLERATDQNWPPTPEQERMWKEVGVPLSRSGIRAQWRDIGMLEPIEYVTLIRGAIEARSISRHEFVDVWNVLERLDPSELGSSSPTYQQAHSETVLRLKEYMDQSSEPPQAR